VHKEHRLSENVQKEIRTINLPAHDGATMDIFSLAALHLLVKKDNVKAKRGQDYNTESESLRHQPFTEGSLSPSQGAL